MNSEDHTTSEHDETGSSWRDRQISLWGKATSQRSHKHSTGGGGRRAALPFL